MAGELVPGRQLTQTPGAHLLVSWPPWLPLGSGQSPPLTEDVLPHRHGVE
jgi:hypothetical protein